MASPDRVETFSVSHCLKGTRRSLTTLGLRPWIAFAAGLVPSTLLALLLQVAMPTTSMAAPPTFTVWMGQLISAVVASIAGVVGNGAVTLLVVASASGQLLRTPAAIKLALHRLPNLVWTSWVFGLCLMVCFMLLVVPGIIVMLEGALIFTAAAVDGGGFRRAYRSSERLTRGRRREVALLLLLSFAAQAPCFGLQVLALQLPAGGTVLVTLVAAVWSLATGPAQAALLAVAYSQMRRLGETTPGDTGRAGTL